MKKYFNLAMTAVGLVVLLGGLLLYSLGIHEVIPVPRPDLLPWCTGVVGSILILSGACELFFKRTKEIEIEENDERNIAITNAAKATGFDVMLSLFSIAIIALALLGYLTKVVFFTFFGVFLIAQVSFVIRVWYLHKKM